MNNLKAIRLAKGMSAIEVANALGVSRQAYHNYESNKRQMDYETLLKLGEILDVSVEDIIRADSADVFNTYKRFVEMAQKNTPDDNARSEIISIVQAMSDDQAVKLRDLLKSMYHA